MQPDWFAINDWQVARGDGFQAGDYGGGGKPVILNETVRKELFGDDDGISQTVRLGRVPFTVVGVLAAKGQGGFGQDQDDVVVVPLEVARRRLSSSQSMPPGAVQQISVGVNSAKTWTARRARSKACCGSGTRSSRARTTTSRCATSARSWPRAPRPPT